jgi:hypothetical protein
VTLAENKNIQIGLAGSLAAHVMLFFALAWLWGSNARRMIASRDEPAERQVTLLFPSQILREPEPPAPEPPPAPKALPVAAPQIAAAPSAPRMIAPEPEPPLAMRVPEPEAVRPAVVPPSSRVMEDLDRSMRTSANTRLDLEVRRPGDSARDQAGPAMMVEPATPPPAAPPGVTGASTALAADALQNPVESAAGRHVTALIGAVNSSWQAQTRNQRVRGRAVISAFLRHDGTLARTAVLEESSEAGSLLTDLAVKAITSTRFTPTPADALEEFPKEGVYLKLEFIERTND